MKGGHGGTGGACSRLVAMTWDWDAEDINPDEDDGKLWVPMMPQMLRMHEMPRSRRSGHSIPSTIPPRQMAVYMVQPNQDRSAEQSKTLIVLLVHTPCTQGPIIIKANLGKEATLRDQETTTEGDVESKLTELLSMPKAQKAKKAPATRQQGVPKNATMVVLTKLRLRPCDQCEAQG